MSELESLIAQKKALENRIKELKLNQKQYGTVRMNRQEGRGGYYNVQTLVKTMSQYGKPDLWFVMIRERTKKEVAHRIRVLITDLSELLANLEKEESCEK